jgi:hypothetical protein
MAAPTGVHTRSRIDDRGGGGAAPVRENDFMLWELGVPNPVRANEEKHCARNRKHEMPALTKRAHCASRGVSSARGRMDSSAVPVGMDREAVDWDR